MTAAADPDPKPEPTYVTVTVTVEVTDARLLRAYTSGFMPVGTVEDRIRALLAGAHMLLPEINGLRVANSEADPDQARCPVCYQVAVYQADLGAPGVGQAWTCPSGHALVKMGGQMLNASAFAGAEPPWIQRPEDVR